MLLDSLKKLFNAGALSHGYIFFGEDVGQIKKAIIDFAAFLEAVDGPGLTDALFIDATTKKTIGIDEIRQLKNFLSVRPAKSPRRTVAILGADSLSDEASSALLKISEDPPEDALIFLVSRHEDNLLPTILSRFQKIYVNAGKKKEISRLLDSEEELEKLARRFLSSEKKERSEIIKLVLEKGEEDSRFSANLFVDNLISLLAKNPVKNSRFLAVLLQKRRLLSTLSLNKRLQLEFFSSLWYNS